jgi:acetyl-CoA acetyltransferase
MTYDVVMADTHNLDLAHAIVKVDGGACTLGDLVGAKGNT